MTSPPSKLRVVSGGRSFDTAQKVVDTTVRDMQRALPVASSKPQASPTKAPDHEDPPHPGRRLAPGAPHSPGTVPLELAVHLRVGEPVVWWDAKANYDLRPAGVVLAACVVVLVFVTVFAPGFWLQGLSDLWPPVAALLSPTVLLLAREHWSLRSLMVSDTAIVEVTRRGAVSRLAFSAIRQVRHDLLTGGILLRGKDTRIRVPSSLAEAARAAIQSQRRNVLRGEASQPDDPLGWLPVGPTKQPKPLRGPTT